MEDETEFKRGPGRPRIHPQIEAKPDLRPEDPRERARLREQEILGTLGDIDEHQDEYRIDPRFIPEGWSWEWKRFSVLNEIQHSHINALKRTGWEFVAPDKYPVVPATNGVIVLRGNALMERPQAITARMEERDRRMADMQMATKAAQLEGKIGPDYAASNKGEAIRAHGVAGARKSYSPMPVPD